MSRDLPWVSARVDFAPGQTTDWEFWLYDQIFAGAQLADLDFGATAFNQNYTMDQSSLNPQSVGSYDGENYGNAEDALDLIKGLHDSNVIPKRTFVFSVDGTESNECGMQASYNAATGKYSLRLYTNNDFVVTAHFVRHMMQQHGGNPHRVLAEILDALGIEREASLLVAKWNRDLVRARTLVTEGREA